MNHQLEPRRPIRHWTSQRYDDLNVNVTTFLKSIEHCRSAARQEWRRTFDKVRCEPASFSREIPTFFLDRYAYRIFESLSADEPTRVSVPDYDVEEALGVWESRVKSSVVGLPAYGIDPPILDDLVPVTPFLEELFAMWRSHLNEVGVLLPGAFLPPTGLSWRMLFKASVHFPSPPVINGPVYFERLSQRQQQEILRRRGPSAPLDFYIFLLQTHEESHMYQAGEPLLCELTHAWLWCDFLTAKGLWIFQRNEDTGIICNLEAGWLRHLSWTHKEVRAMYLDTAKAVTQILGAATYEQACRLAARLDSRRMSYQRYLYEVTTLLA